MGARQVAETCEEIEHIGSRKGPNIVPADEALPRITSLIPVAKRSHKIITRWLKEWYKEQGVDILIV